MVLTKMFEFNNRPQDITGFTRHFLDDLTTMLMQYHHEGDLLFKVKTIVTELLNNAVKHSGAQQTTFEVNLDSSTLTIVKKDAGKHFELPLQAKSESNRIVVSHDAMHLLYAVVENEDVIRFFWEDTLADNLDINQLNEHMGLLIITKAANEFTYQYQNPVNLFTVKLSLS
jgi:hypothetical protein